MALNCNLEALILASKDFLEPAISEQERQAIQIYLRAQGLLAAGGADLTDINNLLEAAKEWQVLAQTQRSAIDVYISLENAVVNGATVDNDIQALTESAKCFLCLPQQTKLQLLEFLRCALSEQNAAD